MTEHLEAGDYVLHPLHEGVRGQVLWTEGLSAYVCWETGYEPYVRHAFKELERTTALDLLVEGREITYEFSPSRSRCKCGLKLTQARRAGKLICSRCKTHYEPSGFRSVQR